MSAAGFDLTEQEKREEKHGNGQSQCRTGQQPDGVTGNKRRKQEYGRQIRPADKHTEQGQKGCDPAGAAAFAHQKIVDTGNQQTDQKGNKCPKKGNFQRKYASLRLCICRKIRQIKTGAMITTMPNYSTTGREMQDPVALYI